MQLKFTTVAMPFCVDKIYHQAVLKNRRYVRMNLIFLRSPIVKKSGMFYSIISTGYIRSWEHRSDEMCRRMEKSQSTSEKGFLLQIVTVRQYFERSKNGISSELPWYVLLSLYRWCCEIFALRGISFVSFRTNMISPHDRTMKFPVFIGVLMDWIFVLILFEVIVHRREMVLLRWEVWVSNKKDRENVAMAAFSRSSFIRL